MKNQIALPASQARESRISLWLNRDNYIFSALMEERVSNRQAVLVSQVLASFSILSCSIFYSLAGCRCLPVLVYLFTFALQERRFEMKWFVNYAFSYSPVNEKSKRTG